MNKVNLIGRLTNDPAIRVYSSEKGDSLIADFAIATDRRFKKDETDFFEVVAFGSTAKFIEKYLRKGAKIAISGRLRQDRWNNQEGQSRSKVVVIADEVEFAGSNPNAGQPDTVKEPDDGFIDIPDDVYADLPFNEEFENLHEELSGFMNS